MRDGVFDYLPKRHLDLKTLKECINASLSWAQNENDIYEKRTRFSQLAEGLPQLAWTCTPDGNCDFLNKRWCEYTGISMQQQLGFEWMNQVHPDDCNLLLNAWTTATSAEIEMSLLFRIRRHDGEFRWFDSRAMPHKDERGKIIRWLGSNTDVHEFEIMRQALTSSEQRFHAAFDYAPLGMMLVDLHGAILQANPAMQHLLGYCDENADKLINYSIFSLSHPEDAQQQQKYLADLQVKTKPCHQYETRYLAYNGKAISCMVSVAMIDQPNTGVCYLFQIYDLSERKQYEKQLIRLAHYDSLTGLGNRAKLHKDINFLIDRSHRSSSPFAVLFGDLDHFKHINDGLGHEAGDHLLKVVARRLQHGMRRGDTVARLGGDEFVILLQDVSKYEAVVIVAEKLIKKINKPIKLGDTIVHIGISFGIALYPTDGDDVKTLLRNADSALYEVKAKGRGHYQLYRKELTEYVHNRLLLDSDLRKAITNNEFELHFQPVINLNTLEIVSAEALIRWNHPIRGMVYPGDFIGYAQESGLITRIDDWVINEACKKASDWQQQGFNIKVAINITALQFQNNMLVKNITEKILTYKLPAENIILEITEQMFVENTEENLLQISQLKNLGVKISLDDFGVGFSSLSYIIRFAPHYLKIDRSFISKLGEGLEHDEMVRTIVSLHNILPMKIIAEGVENNSQRMFLEERGCNFAQGYLFSKPLSFNNFLAFLNSPQKEYPDNI
jgi:diguanylate cyclase (GGDEF)-like protein/PAS domain S-box-containing protein